MKPDWLKETPASWEKVPFGSIFTQSKRKNTGLQRDFVLSVMKDRGVIPYTEKGNVGNKVSEDLTGYKLVDKGDFVLNSMNLYMGSVGVSAYDGVTSTAYIVCKPSKSVYAGYYSYLIQFRGFQEFVGFLGKGIMEIREAVRWTSLKSVVVPLPDLPTQRAIADFLDRETARIDTLIEKKQRLVELLGEKFFSFLESKTFLGSIPSRELMPFRWVCRIAEGQVDPTSEIWRERTLIAPNHIESKTGRLLATETAEEQGAISGKYAYSAGTVLYSKIRPALAKACIAPEAGMCSADMYPIIPDRRLRPEYLLMQLLSSRFTEWATLESMRVAMPKINRETLGGFRLRVPNLTVQDAFIQEYIVARKKFEAISDAAAKSIDRLKEYRSALITSAVTGQIDVTKWTNAETTDRQLDAIEEEFGA